MATQLNHLELMASDYLQRLKTLMEPTADWGPKLQVHRIEAHSPKHTDSQVRTKNNLGNTFDQIYS